MQICVRFQFVGFSSTEGDAAADEEMKLKKEGSQSYPSFPPSSADEGKQL